VEVQPTPQGYFELGRILASTNHKAEAITAYENALKLDPEMNEAQQAVAALR
jgi:cytochrome c-type biogenesis protein CcmH/NrfG